MSVERNKNLNNLLEQFEIAENPAAKADLANSISFANAQLKNDAQMMETMSLLMQHKETIEANKASYEKIQTLKGEGLTVDYSSAADDL